MIKRPKTALDWVHLFWMIAAGAVILYMTWAIVQLIADRTDFKQWDLLAFSGSIIGGAITWWGVRASIKHSEDINNQERLEKQVEEAAKKARMLDKMISTLGGLLEIFSFWVGNINRHRSEYDEVVLHIKAANKEKRIVTIRDMVDTSVNIDAYTYKAMFKLEKLILRVHTQDEILFYMIDDFYYVEESVDLMIQRMDELIKEVVDAYSVLDIRRMQYLQILFPNDDPDLLANE